MSKKFDAKLWRHYADLYCQNKADTFRVAQQLVENYVLPDLYLDALLDEFKSPSLAKEMWLRIQQEVCQGVLAEIKILVNYNRRQKNELLYSEGSADKLKTFASSFPQKMSPAQAAKLGRKDGVNSVINSTGSLFDELISPEYKEADGIATEGTIKIIVEMDEIRSFAIQETCRNISERLSVYGKLGDVAALQDSLDGWASLLPSEMLPYREKNVPEFLEISERNRDVLNGLSGVSSPATTALPVLAKQ